MTFLNKNTAASAICLMGLGFIAAALCFVLFGRTLSTTQMFIVSVLAFGLVVIVLLSPLPSPVRAILSIAICCAAVLLFAQQDIFGLRNVTHSVADARSGQSSAGEPAVVEAAKAATEGPPVHIVSPDDSVSREFIDSLNDTITRDHSRLASGIALNGEVRALPASGNYRFTWAIARNGDKLWCGVMTSPSNSVASARHEFVRAVEGAIKRSTADRLVCL
ncbi:hypothetical protein [Sphingomonas sp. PWP1-2]|uniref:hypothetical protein n=1 Tax=Sphingomonas sp. PWP1-2 TaxID=2804558 RepID=UPI003CFB5054